MRARTRQQEQKVQGHCAADFAPVERFIHLFLLPWVALLSLPEESCDGSTEANFFCYVSLGTRKPGGSHTKAVCANIPLPDFFVLAPGDERAATAARN